HSVALHTLDGTGAHKGVEGFLGRMGLRQGRLCAEHERADPGEYHGSVVCLAPEHDAIQPVERPDDRVRLAETTIDDHLQIGESFLYPAHDLISQRRNLPIVLRRQSAEHRFARVDDHGIATGIAQGSHETMKRRVLRFIETAAGLYGRPAPPVNHSYPHLHRHRHPDGCTHGGHAGDYDFRPLHQVRSEHATRSTVAGATAVQVDLVISRLLTP